MDSDIIHQNMATANLLQAENKIKKEKGQKELKEACQGFEAIFLNTMLKSMRDTLPKDTLFNSGNGVEIYQSMYDQYLTQKLSEGEKSLGIKEFLYQELKDSL